MLKEVVVANFKLVSLKNFVSVEGFRALI